MPEAFKLVGDDILTTQTTSSGTIPPELGGLTALRHLALGNNQLTGEV